jgi:hypothetical protein
MKKDKRITEINKEYLLNKVDWSGCAAGCACWNWIGATDGTHGYGEIHRGGKGRTKLRAHRVAYELWIGPIPEDKPIIRHTCDNPSCINPSHLVAGTSQDNVRDKVERNRQSHQGCSQNPCKGEKHPWAKLTDQQCQEIRVKFAAFIGKRGDALKSLSQEYNTPLGTINGIVYNYTRENK